MVKQLTPTIYKSQSQLISASPELDSILVYLAEQSRKITNIAIYFGRQKFFKSKGDDRFLKPFTVTNEFKTALISKSIYSQSTQACFSRVTEMFKSFYALDKKYKKGELDHKPNLPKYLKNKLTQITYPSQHLKLDSTGNCIFPLGNTVKRWFGIQNFKISFPPNLDFSKLAEVTISPTKLKGWLVTWVYKDILKSTELNPDLVLGIDLGLNNLAACVDNLGNSFLINGRQLKSFNNWYNKQLAKLKEGKSSGFWSLSLAEITQTRNNQVKDFINKTARIIINHCIQNSIGNIVIGWNAGIKDGVNMGKKNNQNFVQIPHARLIERLEQLGKEYGIRVIKTEESYTSKVSFLDSEEMGVYGERTVSSKAKRVKRGLLKLEDGSYVNADLNGAANIIRKVKEIAEFELSKINKGVLSHPTRINPLVPASVKRNHRMLASV